MTHLALVNDVFSTHFLFVMFIVFLPLLIVMVGVGCWVLGDETWRPSRS